MTAPNPSIIGRIRKLNALAQNAGTEAEAALAASRIADLCAKHNLEIGSVNLSGQQSEASTSRHESSGTFQAHWSQLAGACEKLFDVGTYHEARFYQVTNLDTGRKSRRGSLHGVVFVGLEANVEAALITYQYLLASVEVMLRSYVAQDPTCSGLAKRRAFRLGCAQRIKQKAHEITDAHGEWRKNALGAIVKLGNELIEKHKASLKIGKPRKPKPFTERDAFIAGYRAGERIDIHAARTSRMLE